MSVVARITEMVEQLSERKQNILLALVGAMIDPDDYLTEEDLDAIKISREEYARGEFVRHEDIDWD